jgi:hypothetical protein
VASGTVIGFEDKIYDTHSAQSGADATWKWTAPISGYYRITAAILWDSQSWAAAEYTQIRIDKNGATNTYFGLNTVSAIVTGYQASSGSTTIYLNAGDYIAVASTYVRAAGNPLFVNGGESNYLTIEKVSAPETIAASEVVAARYAMSASSANLSIANSTPEILDFDTKVFDTHGAVTTGASWKFTAPVSGIYDFYAVFTWNTLTNMTVNIALIYVNGAQNAAHQWPITVADASVSCLIKLNAGDYINILAYQTDSGSAARTITTNVNYDFVTIKRIGGVM